MVSEAVVASKRTHHFVVSYVDHGSGVYDRFGSENKKSNKTLFVPKILTAFLLSKTKGLIMCKFTITVANVQG